jgi:hypothetical protein
MLTRKDKFNYVTILSSISFVKNKCNMSYWRDACVHGDIRIVLFIVIVLMILTSSIEV